MTAIEHKELKGITIKNLVVTIMSTASIVVSVMSTYFGLKNDIRDIKASRETETKVTNIRLKILEDRVDLLQKEVEQVRFPAGGTAKLSAKLQPANVVLLSAIQK